MNTKYSENEYDAHLFYPITKQQANQPPLPRRLLLFPSPSMNFVSKEVFGLQ